MSATDHLTLAEMVIWRTLVAAARAAVDRPSQQAFRVFEVAAKKANKTPIPAQGDPAGMSVFHMLVTRGLNWVRWQPATDIKTDVALRIAIDACAQLLGPEPRDDTLDALKFGLSAPRKPYYLEDDE